MSYDNVDRFASKSFIDSCIEMKNKIEDVQLNNLFL